MQLTPEAVWEKHLPFYSQTIFNPTAHAWPAPEFALWITEDLEREQLFPADRAQRSHVPQLTVFTYFCAPRNPSREGLQAAVRFLYIFFLFNDYWEQVSQDLEPSYARQRDFIAHWPQEIREQWGQSSAFLLESFEKYRQALYHEQELEKRPEPISLQEYQDRERGRFQWVGTPPYIDLWEVTEGLVLTEEQRALTAPLRAWGIELTYIANDLGSMRRDPKEKNFISLLSKEEGLSIPEAIRAASQIYQQKAQEFLLLAHKLWNDTQEPKLRAYLDMVAHVTDGNLLATTMLASVGGSGRYATDARELLEGLCEHSRLVPHFTKWLQAESPSS